MNTELNYFEINKNSWNKRTDIHVSSDFYQMDKFLSGLNTLNSIELDVLGNIEGLSVLHLQCHFGQDSLSLERMGARVTAVDFSDKSIDKAKELALKLGLNTRFICCNIYDLTDFLDEQFDLVFTSYGTIGWLPDLDRWAKIISKFLKPGGKFVFAEFHPVVWMFDNDFKEVGYSYFNTGAINETETGTYADKTSNLTQEYVCWNHGVGEVLGSLLNNQLKLSFFKEYDYSPYNCFSHTQEFEPGKFRIEHLGHKIPLVYALMAVKSNN
jgi:SAM-dependent methyltransferase